eukprot:gb/GECH01011548.1/.p1 GENE.gb/GECH01011548.1/~~gb/GECH01011548.1/.p1  ORF type:complete len:142 (+),score=20.77 gb/GECH01011548.1/:1-426(+)
MAEFDYKTLVQIMICSLFLAVGVVLCVLGCALYNTWHPIFVFFFYIFTPFPEVICGFIFAGGSDPLAEEGVESVWKHIGAFLTGALFVCGPALALVLAHADVYPEKPGAVLGFILSGGAVIYGTMFLAGGLVYYNKKNSAF